MRISSSDSLERYGIVVDSGSSGSRIQIYKWEDYKKVRKITDDEKVLNSPTKIYQDPEWKFKITPGISTFNDEEKVKDIWPSHFSKLMEHAQQIIPKEKHKETPVFVLATAGMRLLPEDEKNMILHEVCSSIKANTDFCVQNCSNNVQVIDGETEGIYGWISLNYLMNELNDYKEDDDVHSSIGFMDMGGASTQISFVPSSKDEIEKHREDLSKVTLRNINGKTQVWNVFSETWLGFGANEARKRYLQQLINLSFLNPQDFISDPCMPKNAEVTYNYDNQNYRVIGLGDYDLCMKTLYPLLMKNVPCKDAPCLFNGVHAPAMDFSKDKFIGISEYWYTANDVFHSGGEYNFLSFNEKVKEFCESSWESVLENSRNGDYSNLDPDESLKDACFKASWVLNILHEGFGLPRLKIDTDKEIDENAKEEVKKISDVHVPFKSCDSVNGDELSWTLGKILLYASDQIDSDEDAPAIGIYPSEISKKPFLPGGNIEESSQPTTGAENQEPVSISYKSIFLLVFLVAFFIIFLRHKGCAILAKRLGHFSSLKKLANATLTSIRGSRIYRKLFRGTHLGRRLSTGLNHNVDLEEGLMSSASYPRNPYTSVLRTRSVMSLDEAEKDPSFNTNFNSKSDSRYTNFVHKPFFNPARPNHRKE